MYYSQATQSVSGPLTEAEGCSKDAPVVEQKVDSDSKTADILPGISWKEF